MVVLKVYKNKPLSVTLDGTNGKIIYGDPDDPAAVYHSDGSITLHGNISISSGSIGQ